MDEYTYVYLSIPKYAYSKYTQVYIVTSSRSLEEPNECNHYRHQPYEYHDQHPHLALPVEAHEGPNLGREAGGGVSPGRSVYRPRFSRLLHLRQNKKIK